MIATARLRTLGDLIKDLAQQICDRNLVLDQRHFRLLVNLSAIEKVMSWRNGVNFENLLKTDFFAPTFFNVASIGQSVC